MDLPFSDYWKRSDIMPDLQKTVKDEITLLETQRQIEVGKSCSEII